MAGSRLFALNDAFRLAKAGQTVAPFCGCKSASLKGVALHKPRNAKNAKVFPCKRNGRLGDFQIAFPCFVCGDDNFSFA